jgi:hypothetical protein
MDEFSDEIALHILSYTTARDLCALASVSSACGRLASDASLWRALAPTGDAYARAYDVLIGCQNVATAKQLTFAFLNVCQCDQGCYNRLATVPLSGHPRHFAVGSIGADGSIKDWGTIIIGNCWQPQDAMPLVVGGRATCGLNAGPPTPHRGHVGAFHGVLLVPKTASPTTIITGYGECLPTCDAVRSGYFHCGALTLGVVHYRHRKVYVFCDRTTTTAPDHKRIRVVLRRVDDNAGRIARWRIRRRADSAHHAVPPFAAGDAFYAAYCGEAAESMLCWPLGVYSTLGGACVPFYTTSCLVRACSADEQSRDMTVDITCLVPRDILCESAPRSREVIAIILRAMVAACPDERDALLRRPGGCHYFGKAQCLDMDCPCALPWFTSASFERALGAVADFAGCAIPFKGALAADLYKWHTSSVWAYLWHLGMGSVDSSMLDLLLVSNLHWKPSRLVSSLSHSHRLTLNVRAIFRAQTALAAQLPE